MDIENMNIEKATERCNQLTKPEHANWIGTSNQIAIKTVLSELEKKDKEIRSLKEKIHFKICKNCYQEFEAKRSDAIYCKECSRKVNNANWYSSLTPEQQEEKRRKSKEAMRRLRSKRKEEGEKYEY